ncbi:N-acetyl-alpha-D-glucosaminyl-diphospho-ditrans, octacis-undecaprenol 4-epimerase [Pseudidiomarina piscicola]|uniref:N-acetyl-alpha-D-glucosaminyl-diphospho-ditrans, octacis-undecaprenol 4-epimerase n=1 Tax=Pseudidiomarina piscicola TaxID=2614830 RepID=A0A6S6WKD4_9GAMM|nr:SDR family oxidoreductase [Pseudidiomarina piscicola]CAB0151221.1 N-acetyl-alpha-D-glucosaminyl-diphospho-ditrans, octacis-undecaprenol 4-epimerase [Pseudidiomarina piscicola]VZT40727.1 N-acetyl-alpha-D-glucosaminyl-diphospho-ditrans, octacis-undecaprenol 4-epimerase [Pseudomonas aeruginosa]
MGRKIAITGATGFLGKNLFKKLNTRYSELILLSRTPSNERGAIQFDIGGNLSRESCEWISGCDVVIHCAARAHIMNESASDPLAEYRKINTEGTLQLARLAAKSGVRRFVYISSIKVHGERNLSKAAIDEVSQLEPVDPYGISKLEAEVGLREISAQTGMEFVIIRPPLIYGPGVKANFESMMNWLDKGLPLPLGAVHNRRSLVGIDNLCDFISLCMDHPKAINETFLVSDQDDVSTTLLIQRLKLAIASKSIIFSLPASLMKLGAALLNKKTVVQRLFEDLYVNSEKATRLLGWRPPYTMTEQLRKTALAVEENKKS